MVNKATAIRLFLSFISVGIALWLRNLYVSAGVADSSLIVAIFSIVFIWSVPFDKRKKWFVCGTIFFMSAYLSLYLEIK